jgi:hypothetical protein
LRVPSVTAADTTGTYSAKVGAGEPVPCGSGHGLGLASKIGLDGQPDIRQAN